MAIDGDSSYAEKVYCTLSYKIRSLRWAWYLTLLGVIIYAIFHAKRRQNVIPIIEPKQNNSLKICRNNWSALFSRRRTPLKLQTKCVYSL
jgi:hypothetical protein